MREPLLNDEKTVAIVFVTPDSAPQDEATDTLVDRLRDDVVPAATAGRHAVAYVSGQTAAFKDIADRIMQRLPLFLLYIIGVTFIVLAMAFRSIVISLTAAVTTILSAFVGFGVLTLVVQEGHLLGPDRARPHRADRDVRAADRLRDPVRPLDGLHGLPHEPHPRGARPRAADPRGGRARHRGDRPRRRRRGADHGHRLRGLHPHARTGSRRSSALLLAVAILTDALIVRMTLVPAFFTLLGEKTWYIPRWLDRLLPNITIEPPHDGEVRPRPGTEQPAEAPRPA